MEFEAGYGDLVERLLGRRPTEGDGIGEGEIRDRERKLGVAIPKSLRQYYRVAGKLGALNKEHNRLYDLRELKLVVGHLMFMEETKRSFTGGFTSAIWMRRIRRCGRG